MNIAQAKIAIRKLVGSKAGWRYDEHAPTAEERESLIEALPALREARDKAKAAREARHTELLRDPEYQRLKEEYRVALLAHDKTSSRSRHRRVTIGETDDVAGLGFFLVLAEGDNWQDAIDTLQKKKEESSAVKRR